MSSHPNHRRGEKRRQDNGPTWENRTPSKGCNSTHVARSRAKWKKRRHRALRRTDGVSEGGFFRIKQGREKGKRPPIEDKGRDPEELLSAEDRNE